MIIWIHQVKPKRMTFVTAEKEVKEPTGHAIKSGNITIIFFGGIMKQKFTVLFAAICFIAMGTMAFAQNAPIDFEAGGQGANWTWTVFENETNPPLEIIANPDPSARTPRPRWPNLPPCKPAIPGPAVNRCMARTSARSP